MDEEGLISPIPARKNSLSRWLKRGALLLLGLGFLILGGLWWINSRIVSHAKPRLLPNAQACPENAVALVLGCSPKVQGRNNLYFDYRIHAALDLWNSGKLRCLIVSGDNHKHGYDEPTWMKEALIAKGIPAEKIVCDYAGFRTLDSIQRAKLVFYASPLVIVSQRFHNERALSIASHFGIDATAFNAREVSGARATKTNLREWLARGKMWLDLHCLDSQAKFLGEPESLPR